MSDSTSFDPADVSTPRLPGDALILDDQPQEVHRLGVLLDALGYRCDVVSRMGPLAKRMHQVRQGIAPPPKVLVVDLKWRVEQRNFELLGHRDIQVPRNEHMFGVILLKDVLSREPSLKGIPAMVFSSFLDPKANDYVQGMATVRQNRMVEEVSKPRLLEEDGLETLVGTLDRLGLPPRACLDMEPINFMPSLVTPAAIERGFSLLANALEVEEQELRINWNYNADAGHGDLNIIFNKLRIALKMLLAIKTIFGSEQIGAALSDPDVFVPGTVAREALARGQDAILALIKAELERRVGGPL